MAAAAVTATPVNTEAAAPAAVLAAASPSGAGGVTASAVVVSPTDASLSDDVKASLAQNKKALEKNFGAQRSSVSQLANRNIAEDRSVAPGLQAVAKRLERSLLANSLNQQLYGRDDHDSLTRSGVMKSADVAPRLRETASRLQYARTRDHIGHALEGRGEAASRVRESVSGGVASRLQGVKRQLEHNMTINKVGHLLEHRSDVESLQQAHILQDTKVAPLLQGPQRMLQRSLVKSHLFHLLNKRPKQSDAVRERWYQPADPNAEYNGQAESDDENRGHLFDNHDDDDEDKGVAAANGHGAHGHAGHAHHHHHHSHGHGHGHGHAHHGHGHGRDQKDAKHVHASGSSVTYDAKEKTAESGYQRRSKNFHLTRILLKTVAAMAEAGELTLPQKGLLKDRIVDQDFYILQVAETYDAENDLDDFKDSLVKLAEITAKR